MGRRAVPNAELKIYREVVNLSKSHTIRKIATVDIAYRMKVSETVIFKRFKTKEELLLKTFIYCFEQIGEFSLNLILDEKRTVELRLEEFKKASDSMNVHSSEAGFILMYLLSEYYEISHLEKVPTINLISIRNEHSEINGTQFKLLIKQALITLVTYSLSKVKGEDSDAFAIRLLPEFKS